MQCQNPLENTSTLFDAPVEREVLNTIVAILQGCAGEQGHPNHTYLSACVGGEVLA